MPFRIAVILGTAIATMIGAAWFPFFGLLVLVFFNFGRPQDDRPNVVELRIPLMMLISVLVGMAIRVQVTVPAFLAAVKRMRLMLLFTGLIGLSVVVNYTEEAKGGFNEFVALMVFCLVTGTMVNTESRLRRYLEVLIASAVFVMSSTLRNPRHIVEQIGGDEFVRIDKASHSLFGNANYLALYMVMLTCLCLALMSYYKSIWLKLLLLSVVGGAGYTFFLANSRGATISFAAVSLVMWWNSKHKLKSAMAGVVIVIGFAIFAPASYWDRLQTIGTYQEDSSAMGRLELWGIAVSLIPEHPVFGVGFNNFTRYAFNTPHEAYLQVAAELGLPALFVYVSLLGTGIYAAYLARKLAAPDRKNNPYIHAASLGIMCCLTAVTIQGFTTGLAHREVVHVFVCLAYCVRAIAEAEPEEAVAAEAAPFEGVPQQELGQLA